MLDFCPFDFKSINMSNLAYELVFPFGWDWEKVKNETVVGNDQHAYINENDTRRDKHFVTDTTNQHVMLLECKSEKGKMGFTLFKEMIEAKNAQIFSIHKPAAGFAGHTHLSTIGTDLWGDDPESKSPEEDLDEWISKEGKLDYIVSDDGIDTWVDCDGDIVMQAMPCCPYCHNRLPIGWKKADDFGAVSLMAPTSGGKTTFLYSMMHNNWAAFKNVGSLNGKRINISSANILNDPTDTVYYSMVKESNKLCRDYGTCPANTQKVYWIPPVFLRVEYDKHNMIIGIYDNAGENLQFPDTIHNPNLKMLLNKMFADIYLFDPKHMKFGLNDSLFRRTHGENSAGDKNDNNIVDILDVYNSTQGLRMQFDCLDYMKQMYFCGVLIKADLLEDIDEIKNTGKYDSLFDRNYRGGMLDINQMDSRSDLVEEMINEFQLLGDKNLSDFRIDYGENEKNVNKSKVSWHCVSSIGCDADVAGPVHGKYAPIRLAEPVVTCILKRIIDNGWL